MDDCRHVSRHELRIDGVRPRLLDAGDDAGHSTVQRYAGGARLERRVHADGTMVERVVARGTIELAADGDFVTILGLRGIVACEPRAGYRTELRRHEAPGELRVEYRFSPTPRAPAAAAFAPRTSSVTTSASAPSCGARSATCGCCCRRWTASRTSPPASRGMRRSSAETA